MIDVRKIAAEAAPQFGLSMKDDPTAWDEALDAAGVDNVGELSPDNVMLTCQGAARENVTSALARVLGPQVEKIATAMDVAIHEDGPLADLYAVLAEHVTGINVDLQPIADAPDWETRVKELGSALGRAVMAVEAPLLTIAQVLAYLNSDNRFDGMGKLKKGVSALPAPGTDDGFRPPKFVAKAMGVDTSTWDDEPAPAAEPAADTWDAEPAADTWDDEPAAPAPAKRKQTNGKRGVPALPVSRVSNFPALLRAAAVTKADIARLAGFSDSYIGYIFAGKKPWPGLRPDQIASMRDELTARHAALGEALALLTDDGPLLMPEGA